MQHAPAGLAQRPVCSQGLEQLRLSLRQGRKAFSLVKPTFIARPLIQNLFELLQGPGVENVCDLKIEIPMRSAGDMHDFCAVTGFRRDSLIVPIAKKPLAKGLWIGPSQPQGRPEIGKRY
jgi:hypothetical protein